MNRRRPWPPDPTKFGAYDYDEEMAAQSRHIKNKKDRRKLFAIQTRMIPLYGNSLIGILGLTEWFIHGRYRTKSARDQAYRVLVRKAQREFRGWSRTEWRKIG